MQLLGCFYVVTSMFLGWKVLSFHFITHNFLLVNSYVKVLWRFKICAFCSQKAFKPSPL